MPPTTPQRPFHHIKIRVAAAVFDGDDVALVRRVKPTGASHYSLPGGNVEPGEDLADALRRELDEELGLRLAPDGPAPAFTWLVDAMVSRPGATPPRKLHLVYRVHLAPGLRAGLRTTEDDEAGPGDIVWLNYRRTVGLHLFPPVPLAGLAHPHAPAEAAQALLPPMNDATFTWV
ncbi:NUDIX hydrolase [Yinghuangia aomiensis]